MDTYEKAYKAVLQTAKQWIKDGCTDKEKICLECVFPELRESEDEMTRNRAIAILKQQRDYWSYDGPIDKFPPATPRKDLVDAIDVALSYLEKQKEEEDKGEISDGYHTFNELYYYRMLYNAAFFNLLPKEWVHKSKKHHDGEECFGGGWFIVMANLPTGQVSNHYELKDWDLFQIPEKEIADEWDGHTPQEAAERLHKYLQEKQKEQKLKPNYCHYGGDPNVERCKYCSAACSARLTEEQKPAWSEEDEKELDCIINILDRLGYEEFCKSSRDQDNEEERFYYKEIQFLKRFKSLRPQPKQEWNEEDKRIIKGIIGKIDHNQTYGVSKDEMLNFLKRL